MKNVKRTAVVLFLVLTLCLSVCPLIGVQASELSGDMVTGFELTDIAYYNASGTQVYKVENGEIKCKVNVLNNTAEAQELILISAVYDTTGEGISMKTAGVGKATVLSKERKELTATVTADSAENRMIKTFIWDTANRTSYKEVSSLTDKSSKKFDRAYLYYARELSTGAENPRRGYLGEVDEQKGTITFKIPYSNADTTAATLKNNNGFTYAGFYFTGAEDTTIECDVEGFEQAIPKEGCKNKYNNLANGRPVYNIEFSTPSEMNIAKKRPTFTFTAEDGSQVKYKVNVLLTVVDDDFENVTQETDGKFKSTASKTFVDPNNGNTETYATQTWYWKKTMNDSQGYCGVKADSDNNHYLTVEKGTADANKNSLYIQSSHTSSGLRDTNGTLVPLHTGKGTGDTSADVNNDGYLDNVSVVVEYDWRQRNMNIEGANAVESYFFVRNNSSVEFVKAFWTGGVGHRLWNGDSTSNGKVEAYTYQTDTWYRDRIILDGFNGKEKATALDGQFNRIFTNDGFEFTEQKNINNITIGKDGVNIRVNDVMIRTGGYTSLDLDNLTIGLLFE